MNVKERVASSKVKTTPLLKATTEIIRNISSLQLKIAELTEYCTGNNITPSVHFFEFQIFYNY